MTIDLAQFKNAEAWEYGDACRQAYWSRFGTTTDAAFFGPTNGALSPWPGHAENFCPVFLPDSTIIATSGMSSPWDPDGWDENGGDTGEGLEYYLDSPRLAGAGMEEIRQSWELALIMSVASHFAGQNYRPTFDFYDCLTLRTRPVEALEDWADDEGMLCLLLGAASGVREDRIEMFGDEVERIIEFDVTSGEVYGERLHSMVFPASHYVTDDEDMKIAMADIRTELAERLDELKGAGKLLEAQRLEQRTNYDLEMMEEMGYCSGIENYSRHLTHRNAGDTPYTLLDYFPEDFLIMIDESHVTLPQIHAMYGGDRSRKISLVDNGFRLPSAFDNRPLTFEEFAARVNQIVYVSATPGKYEMQQAQQVTQQIIRPTGLLDPVVEVRPLDGAQPSS